METHLNNELEQRFLNFSISVIKLTQTLKSRLPFSVIDQVIRSSTSVGANYSEAQNASSRADFNNKIFIAKKEASETRYWLTLITKLTDDATSAKLVQESQEILLILQKIITTLKNGGKQ